MIGAGPYMKKGILETMQSRVPFWHVQGGEDGELWLYSE